MKRKIIVIVLALALCAGFTVPALAAKIRYPANNHTNAGAVTGLAGSKGSLSSEDNSTAGGEDSSAAAGPGSTDGAAGWAVPELEKALAKNLILDDMVGNWTQPINRLDAAEAIVRLIEQTMRTDAIFIAELKGYDVTDHFTDTDSAYASFLKQSGISEGVDGERYDPNGTFTRAQMVTMLGRMAKYLFGVDTESFPKGSATFSDVPAWADEYIGWAVSAGVTEGVGAGRFGSNGTLQNQHTGVFSYRTFLHFGALKHDLLRTGELQRTGEYLTVEQMEKAKRDALSWQSAIAGIGSFAEIIALEPSDGESQQVYLAFRGFDQGKGDFVIHDEGYEKLQIITPDGTRARIYYAGSGYSTELRMGFILVTEDSKWIEEFFFCPLDSYENTQWENTTEFIYQLYLGNPPWFVSPFE